MGDINCEEGEVVVHGSIAYAPQHPWILSTTVRDNILFSHEYDEVFYNLVIEGCALGPDLALLPHSDMTEVGEKGITLSGGQQARISLARAVYARADLVLLDDCLAAVDSHVARHIIDNVFQSQSKLLFAIQGAFQGIDLPPSMSEPLLQRFNFIVGVIGCQKCLSI